MGRRLVRTLVVAVVVAVVLSGAVVLVRAANGDYDGDYHLTGYFTRAGEGLTPGSEVVFRGVQVGRVSSVSLAGSRARIGLLIEPTFKVPADATATVAPVNLFGAEEISLRTPGDTTAGPWLAGGGVLAHTATTDELGDLFAAATPLLRQIDTVHLADVVSELAQASAGEGPRLAASFGAGARLATFLDSSLSAQLAALDSFARFTAALAPDGPLLNSLAHQENLAFPAFVADEHDYQSLLTSLTGFSDQLGTFLADYHPDFATLLSQGDNVARLLLAQQDNVGQVVQGAYQYALKFAEGGSQYTLPDGSRYAYFNTFILFSDVNTLVCNLLTPAQSGLSFLEPLQQALAGGGTPFNCSSQLAAFDRLQGTAATPASPPPAPAAAPSTASAAQGLVNQAYGALGHPSVPTTQSLGSYVDGLLGGGS